MYNYDTQKEGKKSDEYEHDKKAPNSQRDKGAVSSVGQDSGNKETA